MDDGKWKMEDGKWRRKKTEDSRRNFLLAHRSETLEVVDPE